MSMTAYNILECRKQRYIIICKEKKEIETPPPPPRARARVLPFIIDTYLLYYDVYNDTRPSGERESGSYSGTRQRNRIQFGPS